MPTYEHRNVRASAVGCWRGFLVPIGVFGPQTSAAASVADSCSAHSANLSSSGTRLCINLWSKVKRMSGENEVFARNAVDAVCFCEAVFLTSKHVCARNQAELLVYVRNVDSSSTEAQEYDLHPYILSSQCQLRAHCSQLAKTTLVQENNFLVRCINSHSRCLL